MEVVDGNGNVFGRLPIQVIGPDGKPKTISGGGAFATSAGFNSTTANAFLGITVNTGAGATWTVNQVFVKIENIQ